VGRFFYIFVMPATLLFLALPSVTVAFPVFDKAPAGGDDLDFGPIRFGRVEVHPGLALETHYLDNVFLEANKQFVNGSTEGKTEDVVFTIVPSVEIELERGAGEPFGFYLLYKGEVEHYDKLRDTQNTFNHTTAGVFNFGGPGAGSDISVGAIYNKSRSVGNFDIQSNLGNRVEIQTVAGLLDFIYSYSDILDFQVDLDYKRGLFEPPFSSQNVDTYDFGGSVFWQATPLAAYGIKYNHRERDYKTVSLDNDNSHEDQVFLAVKWEPTTLFVGEFSIGAVSKRFQNVSEQNNLNLVYQFDLNYHPRERTEFYLRGNRQILDSTFGTIQSYVFSNVGLGLIQNLGKKFKLQIDGVYTNLDYKLPAVDFAGGNVVKIRKDNNVEGSVTLIYQIKWWLQAKARYSHRQNRSNFDNADFISHTGLFEISSKY